MQNEGASPTTTNRNPQQIEESKTQQQQASGDAHASNPSQQSKK